MYYVSKRMEIAGSHKLSLSYQSKCENLHGSSKKLGKSRYFHVFARLDLFKDCL